MTDDPIRIRSIQQYLYCPKRWGYLETECEWRENAFVVLGDFLHARVDGGSTSSSPRKITERSVHVYDDALDIYGVVDCLEFYKDPSGRSVPGHSGTYRLKIVEYKPTAPGEDAYHMPDAMQLLAQKLAVESVYGAPCETELYYADRKRRVPVSFTEQDEAFLKKTLEEMRAYRAGRIIPAKPEGQKCSGCSFSDVCLPKAFRKTDVREYLLAMAAEESE